MRSVGVEIDPDLGHGLDDGRVDGVGRSGACRTDHDPVTGVMGQQGGCHLRAPGVVDAYEQHLGPIGHTDVGHVLAAEELCG